MIRLAFWISALAFAQDPYTVAPKNYHLEFENPYVRVSRVSYRPGDKLAVHDHPALPTIYIYTTDGGPILFGHQEFQAIRRPEVKAWQIRFNRGNKETHTTEYLGDAPSEYLRIELKTERVEIPRRDVRMPADNAAPFENAMLKIERVACPPCLPAAHAAVIVNTEDRSVHWVMAGGNLPGRQIRVELKTPPAK